jgi:hypothetical protein
MSVASQSPANVALDSARSVLAQLRGKIQRYLFGEGLFATLAWIAAAFWITLAIDWTLEPPAFIRALMLLGVVGVSAWLLYRYWLSRSQVPMTDTSMALLLERKYRDFKDSLITSVELTERPQHAEAYHPLMLQHTQADAALMLKNVTVDDLINRGPLANKVLLTLFGIGSVVLFAVMQPEAFSTWKDRVLLLSDGLWPRKTFLEMEGFDASKIRKVGKDGETTILVKADLAKAPPSSVRIYYTNQISGERNVEEMFPLRSDGGYKFYQFKIADLKESLQIEVRGGDARLTGYQIQVVDNPILTDLKVTYQPPAYISSSPIVKDKLSGLVQIPQGSTVTLTAKSNKPLDQINIDLSQGADKPLTLTSGTTAESGQLVTLKNGTDLELQLGELAQDTQLIFRLRDLDQIASREVDVTRLNLGMVPDQTPIVSLRLAGISSAITPNAMLPIVGSAEDDHGLSQIWIEYFEEKSANSRQYQLPLPPLKNQDLRKNVNWNKEQNPELYRSYEPDKFLGLDLEAIQEREQNQASKPAAPMPMEEPKAGDMPPAAAAAPMLQPWKLNVGQKLNFVVKATDNSTLKGGPFTGAGERYQLEVVSPEQMAAILEAREVTLRQRFETIISEFTQTRDNLSAIRFRVVEKTDMLDPLDPEDVSEQANKKKLTPEEKQRLIDEERAALTSRALEKVERSAYEVQELSRAFLEILEEFQNNRIIKEQNETRLRNQIANPLSAVGVRMIDPTGKNKDTLKLRLLELQRVIADPNAGPKQQNATVVMADQLLVELKTILEKMLELEDYNQLLAKLRKVIEEQEKKAPEIKQIQKQKLLE